MVFCQHCSPVLKSANSPTLIRRSSQSRVSRCCCDVRLLLEDHWAPGGPWTGPAPRLGPPPPLNHLSHCCCLERSWRTGSCRCLSQRPAPDYNPETERQSLHTQAHKALKCPKKDMNRQSGFTVLLQFKIELRFKLILPLVALAT